MKGLGLILILFTFGGAVVQAQSGESIPYLIQLRQGVTPGVFREKCGFGIQEFKEVDRGFRLYLVQPNTSLNSEHFLSDLRQSKWISACQQLNTVSNRGLLPNDPLLAQQKYLNIIRAADVWPYQNGGLNRRGDTLVIAIVDSGMDTLHPDLTQNHWVNYGEIPDNQMDDDSNGYVDDRLGWNGGDSNARTYTTVTLDGHGNAIAGILGARGNNGIGISGLNWSIKLMPVVCYAEKGSTSDIGVIRSMIYIYRMKQLYLTSGGAKGANIVAVNTSVGIDRAFLIDAPIWCAMYDSLGSVGILSAVATTNSNFDVEQKGDIPSLCPSDYTLVVSNTSLADAHITSGYSNRFVDLGAPGENIYSTSLARNPGTQGPYAASFNGTSFSTPMVAGTIGYLYQTVCDTFLSLVKSHPDSAMRLLKSWVMEGVKPLAELNGTTVSGGRLDMYGTWKKMDDWCRAQDKAYGVTAANILQSQIFPNPAGRGEWVTLQCNNPDKNLIISVSDIGGKQMSVAVHSQENGFVLNTSTLSPGVYCVRILDGERELVKKLQIY